MSTTDEARRALLTLREIVEQHRAGTITDSADALDDVAAAFGRMLPEDSFVEGAQMIVDDAGRIERKYGSASVRESLRENLATSLGDVAHALGALDAMTQLFPEEG